MDRKVLLQELADGLVSRRGLAKKDAEQFVRTVFDMVAQYLEIDKVVKIKGLGTFKIVQVSSRESVNVNTGERFRIDGHAKVTFVPDAVLKDEVNKPFVHFETVVINEGTSIADMERMDVPEEQPEEEEAEEREDVAEAEGTPGREDVPGEAREEETAESSEESPAVPCAEESPAEEADASVPEVSADGHPVAEGVPVPQEQQEQEAPVQEAVADEPGEQQEPEEPAEPEATTEEVQAPADWPAEETGMPVEEPETPVQGSPAAEEPQAIPVSVEHLQADYQRVESQKVEGLNVTSQRVEHQTIENQHIVQPEKEPEGNRGMRITPWGMVGLLFMVLLLMLGSYYAGYYGLLCPTCVYDRVARPATTVPPAPPSTASRVNVKKKVEAEKKDSTAQQPATRNAENASPAVARKDTTVASATKAVAPKPAAPEKNEKATKAGEKAPAATEYKQVPGGKYIIVGTRKVTEIKPGQTLRGIALEEYGSKGYASYIIVHNGIADPDRVEAGKILKLPELKLRDQ